MSHRRHRLIRLDLRWLVLALVLVGKTKAQSPGAGLSEPKVAGIIYFVDSANNLVSLEYRPVERQGTKLQVHGEHSPVRFPVRTAFRFLVRLPPKYGFSYAKVDSETGYRTVTLKRAGEEKKSEDADVVHFKGGKIGENSMLIRPEVGFGPGEYCMGVVPDESFCFGVDDSSSPISPAVQTASSAGQAAMSNADVIKLVSAGISSDLIVSTIRQASGHSFDLSVDGLISLKKSGVPDAVVAAMQQSTGAGALPASQSAGQSVPDTMIPEPTDIRVFYSVNPLGRLTRLEPTKVEITGQRDELIEGHQVDYKLFGARSAIRTADGMISIVVKVNSKTSGLQAFVNQGDITDIRGLTFRRWESVEGARRTRISARRARRETGGPTRARDPGEFEYTTFKLGDTFFKIKPIDPLLPGEYCISLGLPTEFGPIYCFGVDSSK